MRYLLPLGVFLALVVLLGLGLTMDPKKVPSPLIDKPAPTFNLPVLHNPDQSFSPEQYRGRVWVLNVWASWCVSCRAEHRVITDLARMNLVDIIGLDYKDEPSDGKAWLQQFGDPYTLSVIDLDGRAGIDWGVYGVPETFVIGKDGLIKYKHIGPVTPESLQAEVLPAIRNALAEAV
jgi:cytochrome c biogenesis protein CcmG/thiol:disulfide interchange protein DsbE